jgi:hypothetical protein
VLLSAVGIAESRHRLLVRETALGDEYGSPGLVELTAGDLLGGGIDIGVVVDGVELAAADGVQKQISGLLDTLEESVVLGLAGSGLLVGVVTQDLLTVSTLDLLGGRAPTVTLETEDSVVILTLLGVSMKSEIVKIELLTFQSLGSRLSIMGSSSSEISSSSSASTFLTEFWA